MNGGNRRKGVVYVLLHLLKGATVEGVIWNWQLSLVCHLRINNSEVCFLTEVPGIKVFSSQVPDSNIIKRD